MRDDRPRTIGWWLLAACVVGALLRFWRIDVQSFWDDEVATFRAAALSLRQIWTVIPIIDSNPPLIYTILHFWRGFGETEAGLRSLAALLGALGVPATYLALRRLVGQSAAVVAAFLFAINPLAIYCGQETRYNTLVTLFGLLAAWAFFETLVTARRRYAVALFGFAALAIYSHYFAFFLLAAMALLWLGAASRLVRRGREDRDVLATIALTGLYSQSSHVRWHAATVLSAYSAVVQRRARGLAWSLTAWVAAGLAFTPFLKFFAIQWLRGVHWRESLGLVETVRRAVVWLFVGHSVTAPPTFVPPLANWAATHDAAYSWVLLALIAPLVALTIYGLLARAGETKRVTLAVFVFVPLAGVIVVSRWLPIFDARYMLPLVPFALGACAAGLVALWRRRRSWAVMTAVWLVLLTGGSLHDYYYSPAHWRQDWRGLAQRLGREAAADDVILFYNFYTSLAFLHYYEKDTPGAPVQYLYVLEERFGPLDVKRRRVADVLDGVSRDERSVWLVDYHGYMDDPFEDARRGLTARGYLRATQECRLPGLWRYCVERWAFGESHLIAALADAFDFATAPPVAYQLADGWLPGDGERRWIGASATIRFRRPEGPSRLRVQLFANIEYLGGPVLVRFAANDSPIGDLTIRESVDVIWNSTPFEFDDDGEPVVTVTITPDRVFVPAEVLGGGDRTPKSLLIRAVALESADE